MHAKNDKADVGVCQELGSLDLMGGKGGGGVPVSCQQLMGGVEKSNKEAL